MASGGNTIGPEYIVGSPLDFNSANYGDDEFANYFKGPAQDPATLLYTGMTQGHRGLISIALEAQKVDRFNASARQHNERVLAARAQKKSLVGDSAVVNDNLPTKSKKPQPDISKEQTVATAGDTVAIVFCKRVSNAGGTWIQPPMIKTGSNNFVGSFLYVISQGEMASSPAKHYAWVGNRNIKFLADQTITLTHYYETVATLAAATNTCPINSGNIYCGLNTYSYLEPLVKVGTTTSRLSDYSVFYTRNRDITRGTGVTTNSVLKTAFSNATVFDNGTGADITAAWLTAGGITSPSTTFRYWNLNYTTNSGYAVGAIRSFPSSGLTAPNPAFWTSIAGATGPITITFANIILDNQYNLALPASTGTLEGEQSEYFISEYANPNSPPGTADYTNFADITFLEINGNIYDPPDEGSYPTTTRQICLYYENGVNVDLYSGGLVSGQYVVGPSNQFVDFAMLLFTQLKRANGSATFDIAMPIDVTNMQNLATFANQYGLHFNGILEQSVNVIDYISSTAPFFFLSFISSGGQYQLQPLLPLNGSYAIKTTAITPVIVFDADNILPGSYSKVYFNLDERRNARVSLLWREADPLIIGMQRTTSIRYTATASDAPIIQYDMTDFCTSANHAMMYGKYELARRKYSTHSISLQTPLITTALKPTDIIEVQFQRINSQGDNQFVIDYYQVTDIKHETFGITSITAEHFPLDANNISVISDEILNGSFEVI